MKSVGAPANNLYLIEPYHGGGSSTSAVRWAVANGVPRDQVLLGPVPARGKGLLTRYFTPTPTGLNHFQALKWVGDKV